jgi:hypothetical protein
MMLPPGEPRPEPVVQPGTEPVVQPGTGPVLRPRAGSLRTLVALAVVGALLVALLASTGFAVLLSVGTGDDSGASPPPAREGASPHSTATGGTPTPSPTALPAASAVPADASSTPLALATPAPGHALARFHEAGLVFDYPAAWHVYHHEMLTSFSTLVAYLATVPVRSPCKTTVKGESGSRTCNVESYDLEPDAIVVRIEHWGAPTFNILETDPGGGVRTTVAGLPAIRTDLGNRMEWKLTMPGFVDNWYEIHADMRGPDLDLLRAQVEALVASLHYDPPPVPLPSGPAGETAMREAVARTLASLAGEYAGYGVFPTDPGTSRSCRITQEPQGPELLQALDATCSTDVEATPLQLWRMTLTMSWPATDAHAAGAQVRTTWLAPDGSVVSGSASGDPLPGS